jgi:hypothetical protein
MEYHLEQILFGGRRAGFDAAFEKAQELALKGYAVVGILPDSERDFGRIVMQRQNARLAVEIQPLELEIRKDKEHWVPDAVIVTADS